MTFEEWRGKARLLLQQNILPEQADWAENDAQKDLFAPAPPRPEDAAKLSFSIPKEFLPLARWVAGHRDPDRWSLLYRCLWRLTHGEKHLLNLTTDSLVHRLAMMSKAVHRDAHKAKAFIRFRLVKDEEGERYIAWHQPDHYILPLVAGFFQRRFAVMRWSILTPDQSLHWDGDILDFGPGAPSSAGAPEDILEDLWRTYYRATFNPARIKLKMMKKEMPVRYWHTMPETRIIADLLAEAPDRVEQMIKTQEGFLQSAEQFLPPVRNIASLREAAAKCEGCPLYRQASCTVFGTGPEQAKIMLVGEQPGDEEDKVGKPFVGPAGKMLDRALSDAGIERSKTYMTNAVKHFKFDRHGIERNHRTPDRREISACHPWLREEIAAVRPETIVLLGATAGRSLLGQGFTLKDHYGKTLDGPLGSKMVPTYHPAAILRMPDPEKASEIYDRLVADLTRAAQFSRAA